MPFQKGRPKTNNAVGVKGKSGRKTHGQEVAVAIAREKKKITDAVLVELATNSIYQAITNEQANATMVGQQRVAQTFGLPIYLKNKADKVIFSDKSYDNDQRARLAERINARRNRNSGGK
jgi:hypothetical protein